VGAPVIPVRPRPILFRISADHDLLVGNLAWQLFPLFQQVLCPLGVATAVITSTVTAGHHWVSDAITFQSGLPEFGLQTTSSTHTPISQFDDHDYHFLIKGNAPS
jgi:hypothetical protein